MVYKGLIIPVGTNTKQPNQTPKRNTLLTIYSVGCVRIHRIKSTSFPGSSRLSIWRRFGEDPGTQQITRSNLSIEDGQIYNFFFKKVARNKVREIWVRQLPTSKMEYEVGIKAVKFDVRNRKYGWMNVRTTRMR